MCGKSARRETLVAELRAWLLSDSTPPMRFSEKDRIDMIPGLSEEQQFDLFCAKYRALVRSCANNLMSLVHSSANSLMKSVDNEFAEMVEITPALGNFLFQERRDKEVAQSQWLHDVQTAVALDHFFVDAFRIRRSAQRCADSLQLFSNCVLQLITIEKYVDMAQAKRVFEERASSRGLLLCCFHGNFNLHGRILFTKLVPDHLTIQLRGGASSHGINADSGRLTAGFRAVKALQQQKIVLTAADGPVFNPSSACEISVLGTPVRISTGAALIAYEANCDTGWYTVVREGEQFVPVCKTGPSRNASESFAEYKDRWMSFYAAEIEKALTGDPRNLAIGAAWSRLWSR
jgi:hypothetical protein